MKYTLATSMALMSSLAASGTGHAQSAMPSTPTTRILAIRTIEAGVDRAKVMAILSGEVRETVKLYLEGKIDQWYSLQDGRGVVFILNVTDTALAHEMLEKLPLGQAKLMSFELMPLGPLNPLRKLTGMTAKHSHPRQPHPLPKFDGLPFLEIIDVDVAVTTHQRHENRIE